MANSKQIVGLIGPTLMVMLASEFPLYSRIFTMRRYRLSSICPGCSCLSPASPFVPTITGGETGLLVTLSGWVGVVLGIFRMFAAERYQRASANTSTGTFMVLEGALFAAAVVMTVKAYSRG